MRDHRSAETSTATGDETAAAAEPAELVPIKLIDPAPDNPRGKIGNVTDLATSIHQHGILQDLLVTPRGSRYLIVAGHRRHKAAKQAGLTRVPCKVRELTDQQRRAIMLVENLQRTDLTPLEEARGYQALLDNEPGLSQHELAHRIGRVKSQGVISRRLSLLKLPARAQQLLAAGHDHGGITLRQAEAFAQFADWPEEILRLLAIKRHRHGPSLDDDIRGAIERAKVRRHAAKIRGRLEAGTLKILDRPEVGGWWDAPARPLNGQEHGRCIHYRAVDVDDHANLACHAVAICGDHGEAVLMCRDHRLHEVGEDADRALTAAELAERDHARRDKQEAQEVQAQALTEAAKGRHAHLRDVLAERVALDEGRVLEHLAWTLLEENRGSARAACQLLGLDPYEWVQTRFSGPVHIKDWRQALHNLASKGRPELLQAALALAMAIGEERVSQPHRRWSRPADARHFAILRELAYQLSAAEQTRLDAEQATVDDVDDDQEDLEAQDEDEQADQ